MGFWYRQTVRECRNNLLSSWAVVACATLITLLVTTIFSTLVMSAATLIWTWGALENRRRYIMYKKGPDLFYKE